MYILHTFPIYSVSVPFLFHIQDRFSSLHSKFTTDAQSEGERLLPDDILLAPLSDVHSKNGLGTERHARQPLDALLSFQPCHQNHNDIDD